MVDFLLQAASHYGLRSMFLANETKELLETLLERADHKQLVAMIYLLSVVKPFINPEEFTDYMERLLVISESKELEGSERLRASLLLLMMKGSNKALSKAIKTRLRRLREQFPKEFKNLLPPPPTKKQRFNPPV